MLLPDRKYSGFWHRILHDQTADAIERAVSRLPHANVTTVPFHFPSRKDAQGTGEAVEPVGRRHRRTAPQPGRPAREATTARADGPHVGAAGAAAPTAPSRSRTVRLAPAGPRSPAGCAPCASNHSPAPPPSNASSKTTPAPCPSCSSAAARSPGIEVGTRLRAQGVAGEHRGRLAILNPTYQLLANR